MPLFAGQEKEGLWPLVPKSPDAENCVDIFAIHGLGGDKFKTWTEDGKLWLRDFLPNQLPEARVFTYGYDATVAFSKSSAELDGFARNFLHRAESSRVSKVEQARPMVVICHSLGGLLFKQALSICHSDPIYREMIDKFLGVVFMGTPHGGSDVAFWASYAGKLLNIVTFGTRTNKDLLLLLRKDSTFLGSLSQKFKAQCDSLQVLTFYETEKFPLLNCRIVEKESAHLEVPNEHFLPIQSDHRGMCRFSNSTSQRYISTSSAIVNMIRDTSRDRQLRRTLGYDTTNKSGSISERHRESLNKWLDPVPMADDFDRKRLVRLEHSCEWIDQNSKFTSWKKSNRGGFFWIQGPPGCGKSTLATRVIEQLDSEYPVAYFFCKVEDPYRSNLARVVRTLTWQLLLKKPHLTEDIYNIYLETVATDTPLQAYQRALTLLVKRGDTYLVIDGLDECHVNSIDLQRALWGAADYAKILISSRHTLRDLQSYAETKCQELDLDPGSSKQIAGLLIDKAKGMFLWVKLTIEYLSQQATFQDILAALNELPSGLEFMYERLLKRIDSLPPNQRLMACKILQWTFSSTRPLSLKELNVGVSIDPGNAQHNALRCIPNIRKFVHDYCGPLLEIDEANGIVRFLHASAIEFFSRAARDKSWFMDSDNPIFIAKRSSSYCAAVCLTYLSYDKLGFISEDLDPQVYDANVKAQLDRQPLLEYCALNWWKHLPKPGTESSGNMDLLEKSIRLFTARQHSIVRWLQIFTLRDGSRNLQDLEASVFMSSDSPFARIFSDKTSYFRHLWLSPSGLFTRWQRWITEIYFNGNYSTPIGIAAFFDFVEVVKSECSRHKHINTDMIDLTPLLLAIEGESPDTVRYAIQNGADLSKASLFGYGPVRYAARNCVAILPYILEAGASVSIKTMDDGGTALHAAFTSPGFHPFIMRELLKRVAKEDLDTNDFFGKTALHHAASIDVDSYSSLISDRSQIIAGARPSHRKLHVAPIEEAFTPATHAEITNWLKAWVEQLSSEEFEVGSTANFSLETMTTQNIALLVQQIKATMLIWLSRAGASIHELDGLKRNALDIVLQTGFAETVTKRDVNETALVSHALTSLGYRLTGSLQFRGQSPLDVALVRDHWTTATAMLRTGRSSEATKIEEQILAIVNGSPIMPRQPLEDSLTTVTVPSNHYNPNSPLDALRTSFMLRACLRKYSRSSSLDNDFYTRITGLIVDFSRYWVKSADNIDAREGNTRGAKDVVRVNLGGGQCRMIEFRISRQRVSNMVYASSRSNYRRYDSYYRIRLNESAIRCSREAAEAAANVPPSLPREALLRATRQPSRSVGNNWLITDREREKEVQIPSESFVLQPSLYPSSSRTWVQIWYPDSDSQDKRELDDLQNVGVRNWIRSLEVNDAIKLEATEHFFAHDIALYSGFGLTVFTAWI
ncbi:hypothetical protein EG329_001045 [Mollisiaceae sp. DMI_Dod_QoI]|nr:hypothetical protein EG329_001045 [Helotiales sp. DMI_Dod_QoI]